jgi:hypothetical protein
MTLMAYDRFVNRGFSELLDANRNPIFGYQHLPILTLEESIEEIKTLVPGVADYVSKAKENCNRNSTLLTWNESAAIYLYSMQTPFFSNLNIKLRAEDHHALKPWFTFLKLFMTAVEKLPSTNGVVWRGVNYDDTVTFVDNDVQIWWGVNSCTMDLRIVQPFLGKMGTLFAIETIHGKDISAFAAYPEEQEVVLMPGTGVRAKCESLSFNDRLFVVHLKEEDRHRLVHMKYNSSLTN